MADSMWIRVPVAMKAKVTEDLKLKIIGDLQNTIKQMEADLNQFDFQAKQVMNQAANDLSAAPRLREQIEVERRKRTDAKAEAEEQLKQAQNLQLGAEIGYGTPLERMVEVKVGDNLQALMGAEILTEDGKIIVNGRRKDHRFPYVRNAMQKVVLGQIVAPHGVRGDLRIMPLTSNTQLFMDMDYLLLPDERRLQIVKARPHKNIMLVTVKEVTSIEEAEMLRGQKVSVYREDMPELPEGRYYVGDLIGLPVLDEEGGQIGVFKDVLQTGSRDVYVIQPPEGKDILVANIPENIREIDLPNRRIIVRLPEWDEEEIR